MQHLFKTTLCALFISLFAIAANAQDKIYKPDGSIIDAKIKSVNDRTVIYKRTDNPDGPEYTILQKEVARIVYQNGNTEIYKKPDNEPNEAKTTHHRSKDKGGLYGKNIFSFTPAAYTADINGGINDVGIGLTYERLVDRNGRLGFNVPIILCFSSPRDFDSYGVSATQAYHSLYFMPGIKFYPARDRVKVRYSMGGSFFCAFGNEPMAVYEYDAGGGVYNPNTGTYTYPNESGTYHYTMYGLMFTNSLNITAGSHVFMALDFTVGSPIGDNRYSNTGNNFTGGSDPFVQMAFKIGYRY